MAGHLWFDSDRVLSWFDPERDLLSPDLLLGDVLDLVSDLPLESDLLDLVSDLPLETDLMVTVLDFDLLESDLLLLGDLLDEDRLL